MGQIPMQKFPMFGSIEHAVQHNFGFEFKGMGTSFILISSPQSLRLMKEESTYLRPINGGQFYTLYTELVVEIHSKE